MAGMTFGPLTMQAILESIPETRKKQRRAEQLREAQRKFQAVAKTPGQGNYQPAQMGGLFPTVQQRQTDYGQIGNQVTGALGDYLMGRQAEAAQGEYDEAQAGGILSAMQQMGGGNAGLDAAAAQQGERPTENTLRAYIGMMGGPDISKLIDRENAPRVQSTFEDDSGEKYLVMSDGEVRGTGKNANFGGQIVTDERDGRRYLVPKTGRFRGQHIPLGDYEAPADLAGRMPGGSQPSQAQVQPLARDELHNRQKMAESGGDPNAVSKAGARGLMQIMPKTAEYLAQKMGVTADQILNDPATNEKAGQIYLDEQLERFGGDQEAALIAYNAGPENAQKWLDAGRDYAALPKREETEPYVRKILGQGPQGGPASTTALSGPPRALTAGEKKLSEEHAEARAKAEEALGATESTITAGLGAIDQLLEPNSGLEDITASGKGMDAYARMPDWAAQLVVPAFSPGTPAANAWANYEQVKGSAFLQAFEKLRGGGQITEIEGEKATQAIANLSRFRDPEVVRESLRTLQKIMRDALGRARRRAKGDFSGDAELSPMSDDDLVNKWLQK